MYINTCVVLCVVLCACVCVQAWAGVRICVRLRFCAGVQVRYNNESRTKLITDVCSSGSVVGSGMCVRVRACVCAVGCVRGRAAQ